MRPLRIGEGRGPGSWVLRQKGARGLDSRPRILAHRAVPIGETMLSHPLGWHPGIGSHFLEPPFPSPPSLTSPAPGDPLFTMLVPGAWIPRHPPLAEACPRGGGVGPGWCLGLV